MELLKGLQEKGEATKMLHFLKASESKVCTSACFSYIIAFVLSVSVSPVVETEICQAFKYEGRKQRVFDGSHEGMEFTVTIAEVEEEEI